jgi:hypothetical protein
MMYWYQTTKDLDSLYQLEKLKTHYYSKITGIQANSYETLQEIYYNKKSIEKAIAQQKELQINAQNEINHSNFIIIIYIYAIMFLIKKIANQLNFILVL